METSSKTTVLLCVCVLLTDLLNAHVLKTTDESLNFLVLGDWGGIPWNPFTTAIEKAVADQMGKVATANNVEFVLALGDNFYYDGVKNHEDHRFKDTYDHVFTHPSLGVNWYFLAGNHDHNGNVSAQFEYGKTEKRWNFPTYFYPLQFHLPSSSAKVDVIMIDTILLCGNSDADDLGLAPKGANNFEIASNHLAWIEDQLKNSRAEYLLVGGHYPVFSISSHGPTRCLVDILLPLLHKYNTTAYLCGHDHNLQHLQYKHYDSTVEYFVSGAAAFIDSSRKHRDSVPADSSKFFWADERSLGGFALAKVTQKQLIISFYAANGKQLYSHTMYPRQMS